MITVAYWVEQKDRNACLSVQKMSVSHVDSQKFRKKLWSSARNKKKHFQVTPSSITFERMKIESSNFDTICTTPLHTKLHLGFLIGCFCAPQDPENRDSLCNSAHFHAALPPRRRPGSCRQNDHFCKRAPPVRLSSSLWFRISFKLCSISIVF